MRSGKLDPYSMLPCSNAPFRSCLDGSIVFSNSIPEPAAAVMKRHLRAKLVVVLESAADRLPIDDVMWGRESRSSLEPDSVSATCCKRVTVR